MAGKDGSGAIVPAGCGRSLVPIDEIGAARHLSKKKLPG
jgi:hypothetical protein